MQELSYKVYNLGNCDRNFQPSCVSGFVKKESLNNLNLFYSRGCAAIYEIYKDFTDYSGGLVTLIQTKSEDLVPSIVVYPFLPTNMIQVPMKFSPVPVPLSSRY